MIKDLVRKCRSYRGYDEGRKITREELLDMIDCARLAPSSVNRQPLKYFPANDPETTSIIQPLTGWAKGLPHTRLPHPGHCPTAFVVICQDISIDHDTKRYLRDVGAAAQTILLAATEKELGGIMIGNFSPARVAEALHFPEHIVPMLIVAIGKPDETVVLTEIGEDGSTGYYRDENDVHYVPKRTLEEIIIE